MRRVLLPALSTFVCIVGCDPNAASVEGEVAAMGEVSMFSSLGLSAASFRWLNGTYGQDCRGRTGDFSVPFSEDDAALDHPRLRVLRNNIDCQLAITSLVTDTNFDASPVLLLEDRFQPEPSTFTAATGVQLYANARLGEAGFSRDFTVFVLVADDPSFSTGDVAAIYADSAGTAVVGNVAPPDYDYDISSMRIEIDVAQTVLSVAGALSLLEGLHPATDYVVTGADFNPNDYDETRAVFAENATFALPVVNNEVPGDQLLAVGVSLASPQSRRVILRRAQEGLSAYQVIELRFYAPELWAEHGCPADHHDGGGGSCVPDGLCASGYHDGGEGQCVPEGECSDGHSLEETGTCQRSMCDASAHYELTTLPTGASYSGGALANRGFVDSARECWGQTSDWQYLSFPITTAERTVISFDLVRDLQRQSSTVTVGTRNSTGLFLLRFGITNHDPCNHDCHATAPYGDAVAVFRYDQQTSTYVGMATIPLRTTIGDFVRYSVDVDQTTGTLNLYEEGALLYEGEVPVFGNLANVVSLSAVAYRWQHAGTCWRDLSLEVCE